MLCCGVVRRAMLENGLPAESKWSATVKTTMMDIGIEKTNPEPQDDPFYDIGVTPDILSQYEPGTILRKRAIYLASFPGFGANDLIGWQMAFVTMGPLGDKQNVVATVMIPPNAGKRDKIVIQSPKASGAKPGCRTSYFLRRGSGALTGAASEQLFLSTWLDRGYVVVMSDAQGQHDAFGSGPTAGRTVLDTIRATLAFTELKLAPRKDVRVAAWGYSAGGLATIWAAQLLGTYAPELAANVVGWSMGGVPYDLRATAYSVNKGIGAGLILGVMRGLANIAPSLEQWLEENLNEEGKKQFAKTKTGCFFTFMPPNVDENVLGEPGDAASLKESYFKIAKPLDQQVPTEVLNQNALMTQFNLTHDEALVPRIPIFVYSTIEDYVVPIAGLDAIMDTWAQNGALIDYSRIKGWMHISGCFAYQSENVEWVSARLEGITQPSKSGNLTRMDVDTEIDDESSRKVLGNSRCDELKKAFLKKENNKEDPWF